MVDSAQWASGCRLRVGGNEVEARLDGVVFSEGFDETKDGEGAQLMIRVGDILTRTGILGVGCNDVQWPAVDDAGEVGFGGSDVDDELCARPP